MAEPDSEADRGRPQQNRAGAPAEKLADRWTADVVVVPVKHPVRLAI